jgi:hypothetical protein
MLLIGAANWCYLLGDGDCAAAMVSFKKIPSTHLPVSEWISIVSDYFQLLQVFPGQYL